MYVKLATLTVCLLLIALALLVMRQQRIQAAHELMVLRRDADRTRQRLWEHEARVAELLTPGRIEQLAEARRIALESAAPMWDLESPPRTRIASVELETSP